MGSISDLYATPVPTPNVVPISDGSGSLNAWITVGSGGNLLTNPMTHAEDLIVGGISGVPVRLPVGSVGYVLTVGSSGYIDWEEASGGFVNPMTTSQDLIVGGFLGSPGRLVVGAPGQVLTVGSSGFIDWETPAGGGGGGGIGGSTGGTDNAILRADGTGGATVQSSGATIDDSGVGIFTSLTASGTANGGLIINNSSSGQPYLDFRISSSPYALIGVNNGADGLGTGPDKALFIRAFNQSIILSGDNGTTPGFTISATNEISPFKISGAASGGLFINNSSSGQPYLYFGISNSPYALIGLNNGTDGLGTGPDKSLIIRAVNQAIILSGNNGTTPGFTLSASNVATFADSLATGTPSGGTAAAWKFGSLVTAASVFDATRYIQLDVGGTMYKLAVCS